MSLQNLSKIGLLEKHETSTDQVRRMLESAGRSIRDATQDSISLETRLDAAYRAITQLCMVALWVNGYRPSKSKPGHHQTMIQSLVHSIGLARNRMLLLDTVRIKRNAIDYTGADVDKASVNESIEAANHLLRHTTRWIAGNKPQFSVRT
ncbi:MAG: DNA-binding protein [Gammaproteobacteria bacterium]|nr:DNA-binding protein [Gammaproteobacteria bacterium]